MSLLQEIQAAAIDSKAELSTVLRKALVLAVRLKHDGFRRWVEQELNGYDHADDLPEYRRLHVQSQGHFVGPFGAQLRNAPIPSTCLPEDFRHLATTLPMVDGISAIASLANSGEDGLHSPWPNELTALVAGKIYRGMNCVSAWRLVPRTLLVGILDTVRNRILNFALQIESEMPNAGDVASGTAPLPQERVSQVFNTYITGQGHNVAVSSSKVVQVSEIRSNDFESLRRYLEGLGLRKSDVDDLEAAVRADGQIQPRKGFGSRVAGWIGIMTAKAASGAWEIGTGAAAGLLVEALRAYYGG